MKITKHENNWTITVTEIDLNTASADEINTLGCLTNYYTLVIVKGQQLSTPREEEICRAIGSTPDTYISKEAFAKKAGRLAEPTGTVTLRVTGEKDKDGHPGLFGFNEELKWHANQVEHAHRRSMVWLYAVKGSKGSVTSFTNHAEAYKDLDDDTKNQIKDLKNVFKIEYAYDERHVFGEFAWSTYDPPLVHTNESEQTGLFLPWLHVHHFVGLSPEESADIVDKLRDHILSNPNYIYDHHWDDGDVIMTEQWLGVHKRHAFEHMDKRLLHRIETNFDKVDFSQLQKSLELVK